MRIVNRSTGEALAVDAAEAHSLWARFRGLMLRRRLQPGQALIIQPCSSIHMMFMRFAIDAVFFDRDGRVTRVARHVRPWLGFAFGGRGAHGVIELPVGAAARIERGHLLEFGPSDD